MKKTLLLIILSLYTIVGFSQSPQSINYQAVARDNSGKILANQSIKIIIYIIEDSANGSSSYIERHSTSTNQFGLFTLNIGLGTVLSGTFSGINWGKGAKYLKVDMDASGGNNYTNVGISKFLSVPYALYSEKSGNSGSSLKSGSGIIIRNDSIVNIAQDKIVTLTAGSNTQISGKYPNFTISSSSPSYWKAGTNYLYTKDSLKNKRIEIYHSKSYTDLYVNDTDGYHSIDLYTGYYSGSVYLSSPVTHSWTSVLGGDSYGGSLLNYSNKGSSMSFLGGDYDGGKFQIYSKIKLNTITMWNTTANEGQIKLYDSTGTKIVEMGPIDPWDGGGVWNYSYTGSRLTKMSHLIYYPTNGGFSVCNSSSTEKAGLYVDKYGDGIIWGDTKSFRMTHPKDNSKEIWYACVEGPEAAAYIRGTASLKDGKAIITFPEHFVLVKGNNKYTVILTPNSVDSKGLAVTNKNAENFEVSELFKGDGNYDFDWEVKAVRVNHENFQVIRNADEMRLADPKETKKESSKQEGLQNHKN
ncbi:MAG: hypothetical protein NTX03_09365 [Bacteroidetes bacterium]|nr:hypothetical protein [Bacteroidota bacterium]